MWDSYHGRYAYQVVTVYVEGDEMTCDEDDLDDFTYWTEDGEYHHEDDIMT